MASTSILLKNGVALLRNVSNDRVVPTRTSILIQGNKIAKIAKDIDAGPEAQIIDCTDKIISPGFIDTHHHGWQTQLKGRHANEVLLEYMVTGFSQSMQFSPKDVFYGQLSGMLEALSAGTTTMLDHSHVIMSASHARNAISATASSGIRAVYAYAPIMRVKSFNPLTYHPNPLEDWVMDTFESLAAEGPWGNGRVTLGFGFDLWFLPPEVIKNVYGRVEKAGVKTLTVHWDTSLQLGSTGVDTIPNILKEYGLLDERMVLSHGNGCTKEVAELIKGAGAHVSATPSTEMHMAMGRPICFDAAFLDGGMSGSVVGIQDVASIGIDCHADTSSSIVAEVRLGLQSARNFYNEHWRRQGKTTHGLPDSLSVEAAFDLATIAGAKALRLEKEVGRIEEGYIADLVLFDAMSPGMLGAAQHDPLAAIIMHSSPADIDTVIVDGVIRKKDGKLLPVSISEDVRKDVGRDSLEWSEVAREVVESRGKIQEEIEKIDIKQTKQSLIELFHVNESLFVD